MSEIKKNIETCRGEDVLAEVSAAPQDPHFGSLVNEAFDPMQQQALHQAGYDGYSEVIAQHKPYTFASAIIQMKSNLLLLLRALWQFPFGSGTLRSLADMWQHYITRLQGSETYGIPSRLSSLTDLPSAPLLLADRKISGVPEAVDGMSLVRMLLDNTYAATITELTDDNRGYSITAPLNLGRLTGVKKLHVGAKDIYISGYAQTFIRGNSSLEEIELEAETAYNQTSYGLIHDCDNVKVVKADKLLSYDTTDHQCAVVEDCASITHFYARGFEELKGDYRNALISWCPELTNVYLTAPTLKNDSGNNHGSFGECPKLIHLEVGCYRLVDKSLNLKFWNPATALDSSLTDLVTDEDCHNNLEQFLKNFRTYIALRLAEQPVGNPNNKTLTLSQAVYDAIKDESHLFVFDEGTMTIYAYLTNIKHWTVTK